MRRSAALALSLLLLPPAGLAQELPDLGDSAQADLPPAMEQRIGQAVLNEYRMQSDFVDDAEITAYISRLGQQLAANSDEARQPFEFFVLRDRTLNAFAMPGGYIGVHTGLITAAEIGVRTGRRAGARNFARDAAASGAAVQQAESGFGPDDGGDGGGPAGRAQ